MNIQQVDAPSLEDVSLANCDSEPVHIPGHIQDFAVLLVADNKLTKVTHCSENAAALFGAENGNILGGALDGLIGEEVCHDLRNVLSLSSARVQREKVGRHVIKGQAVEIWVHLSDGLPIIELEPVEHDEEGQDQAIPVVRSMLAHLQQQDDFWAALNDAAVGLRRLTNFDRVMVYKFDNDGDGEVVAEARAPGLEAFLGLRFPKWDIPNQARAIMKKLPLRVIANVAAERVPLLSLDRTAAPVDLTLAASRATSPIHTEYLGNMGVEGSMTLSVVVRDELWGLIAFHHRTPRRLGPSLRAAAELFIQFFCLQIEQRLERVRNAARATALTHQTALLEAADTATDIQEILGDIAEPFCNLMGADGMAICAPDGVSIYGMTPDPEAARAIANALLAEPESDVRATTSIKAEGLDGGKAAGALALSIDETAGKRLVFFRSEASSSVRWAGAPDKEIVEEEDGPRLRPRGSFKVYLQSVDAKSLRWTAQNMASAHELRRAIVKADESLFRRLSQKEERQRSIYIAELNHRVRNILALIRSLSRRAQESSSSLESYAKALEQRISALGAAHDLAANRVAHGVSIGAVFETEAKPYLSDRQEQFYATGDPYLIRSDVAPIFALVVHELVTNCVKYGALSVPSGSVSIHTTSDKDGLTIVWKERGGPVVEPPTRRGFGIGLIEKAIPYELDGDSIVEFLPDGVTVTFWLPSAIVEPFEEGTVAQDFSGTQKKRAMDNVPKKVLVVEDSMMVAIDMVDMFQQIGVHSVETAATVAQALRLLEDFTPDFALLDVSLRRGTTFEVATVLQDRGIPFCFGTGYGSDLEMPDEFKERTILTKPVDSAVLHATVLTLYGKDPQ